MKRPHAGDDEKMKKLKPMDVDEQGDHWASGNLNGSAYFDDNLLFEVFKHVDAKTLAMAGCVSKQWHKTAQDERLWELICTKQWANTGCGELQLRSVVLALGGFRRLHALYLWPLSKPQSSSASTSASSSSSSAAWPEFPPMIRSKPSPRLGKDEVHLSLSLLSIRYYEKMNFNNRTRENYQGKGVLFSRSQGLALEPNSQKAQMRSVFHSCGIRQIITPHSSFDTLKHSGHGTCQQELSVLDKYHMRQLPWRDPFLKNRTAGMNPSMGRRGSRGRNSL